MRLGLKTVGLTATVAALALSASAVAGGQAKTTAQVSIEPTVTSGYYDPKNLTVHKGDKVNWTWNDPNKGHSVWLKSGPNGVKNSDFRSPAYNTAGKTWAKRFRKPGEYKFFCSLHPTMTMKIEVKH